ncbi:T9SS type A sorting domain-containing protein [Pedobacter cryophilus]|nr:T9SS type A sorting domain-containing protein [Pedobacter cryophilus]
MKKLLLFLLLLASTITKAQIGGGFDFAMNFGGAGSEIQTLKIDNQNNTCFVARIIGKAVFAGQQLDGGAFGSFPQVKTIIGKLSPTGAQTLIRDFGQSSLLKGIFNSNGDFYGLFTGNASLPVDFGNGIILNNWGLYLIKFNNSGDAQFIKKVQIGNTDIQFGNSGIAIPNVHGLDFTPDGSLYVGMTSANIDTNAPNNAFRYPARVAKFDVNGDEVWHNDLYSANWASLSFPNQFVSNDGKVSFGIYTNSNQWYFNGQSIASEMSNYVNSAYSIIISLNADGTKNFTLSDGVSPTLLRGVNPLTGDLYVNYISANVSTFPTRAPYNTLPNSYPNYISGTNFYLFQGTLIFNSAGSFVSYKLNQDFSESTFVTTQNGYVGVTNGLANNVIDKGGDYIFNNTTAYSVVSYYDQNFNFLKAVKAPPIATYNALGNKVVMASDFKTVLTLGTTTLTPNFNDTDFNTRFPAWASIKSDIYIAKVDENNIIAPSNANWLGIDNNWNNTANWSNGAVPDASTIVKFNATTAQMPTIATSPTALKVIINAGVTASLPTALVIKNKLIVNGTLQINHTGALNFTNYSATAIEGTGTLAFNGTSTPSVTAYSLVGYKDLSLSTNENITLSGIWKNVTFSGTNAIISASGGLEITNTDANAISGFSSTNFIEGKITRAVNSTGVYVFPNRQAFASYEPTTITLNSLTGVQKITVENSNGANNPNLTFATGTTTSQLGLYYWRISSDAVPTGGTYDVSFQKSVFTNGVTDPNRYVVLKREKLTTQTPWTFEGTKTASTQTGGTTSGSVVSNATVNAGLTDLSTFGDFTIGINSTAIATNTGVITSTWTGATNTTWNNTGNWSAGIPNATINAIIPSGLTNYPLVYAATDNARTLTINSGITGLKLHSGLILNNGLTNNSEIEIARLEGFNTAFNGYLGGISGSGTLKFEALSGFTSINAGVVSNNISINIGNANSINVLGKFGGNINIISGLVNAWSNSSNYLEQTNALSTLQIAAPINAVAAEKIIKSVNTTGTYLFPLGDFQYHRNGIRKYGEITITNNNISTSSIYNVKYDSYATAPVSFVSGADIINSFINAGQWFIEPSVFSNSGTIDISLKTSQYTNGRVSISDYVLLRRAATSTNTTTPWVIVTGASIIENAGVITVSATGLAPFSTNTMFCIGLKATTTTWLGTTSANWNTASNWSNGVPTSTVKAVIGNAIQYPSNVPTSNAASVIEVASGSTLNLPQNFYSPLGIINNGSVNITGTGIFYGFGSGTTFSSVTGTGKLIFDNNSPATFDSFYLNQLLNNGIEINKTGGITLTRTTSFGGNVNLINGVVTVGSGQIFKMTNSNATISSTATSYINGKLDRNVNASGNYSFPVGSSSTYSPVSINFNSIVGPTVISSAFTNTISGSAPNVTVGSATVSEILNGGIWTISPNVSLLGGNYDITLNANGSTNGSSNPLNYVVLKRDYSYTSWGNYGSNNPSSQTGNSVTVSASGITGFSDFGVGVIPSVLPVKLTKFLAKADEDATLLHWETASEINNDKFIIERSTNGTDFIEIAEVKGNGTSNQLISYHYKDNLPAKGINYYRLKQVDFNGIFEYSDIRAVNFSLKNIDILLYPNPVTDVIYLSGMDDKNFTAYIYNTAGKVLFQQNFNTPIIKIPSTLNSGLYMLKLKFSDGNEVVKKVLIKNSGLF